MKTEAWAALGWFILALLIGLAEFIILGALYDRDLEISLPVMICYVQLAGSSINKVLDAAKLGISFRRQLLYFLSGIAIVSVALNVAVALGLALLAVIWGHHKPNSLLVLILGFLVVHWILDRLWNRWAPSPKGATKS